MDKSAPTILPITALTQALISHPAKLFVETTTRCNLSCAMCVKQRQGEMAPEGDLDPALFTALEPALPHLDALILNGVGEPLLHPQLEQFIRKGKQFLPRHGWVGFQSNGLLMTNQRALSLVEAGLDRVCLSIDSVSPEKFREVRQGGELEGVERALSALAQAKLLCNRPEVQVGVEFVAMRHNLHELPAALRWAARRGASFAIVTHLLPYDELHSGDALFGDCTAEAIELFKKWVRTGEEQGLDIKRYFEVRFLKYSRSPEEQALVSLVDGLKEEASRLDILVDLKKLLRLDFKRLESVEQVFAQAREVAAETGLDLRLPEITLREERRCSFVEEGSAFVSWRGEVSPCYFLWRRFDCYASGWSQQIQHKVFGSVADMTILDVWNLPEYQEFRRNVLAYDYPACSSCTLAPCDYVQNEEFEQDCHIRSVPCGACLWCMGVFQCLR